jgi:hypothetical protein
LLDSAGSRHGLALLYYSSLLGVCEHCSISNDNTLVVGKSGLGVCLCPLLKLHEIFVFHASSFTAFAHTCRSREGERDFKALFSFLAEGCVKKT